MDLSAVLWRAFGLLLHEESQGWFNDSSPCTLTRVSGLFCHASLWQHLCSEEHGAAEECNPTLPEQLFPQFVDAKQLQCLQQDVSAQLCSEAKAS